MNTVNSVQQYCLVGTVYNLSDSSTRATLLSSHPTSYVWPWCVCVCVRVCLCVSVCDADLPKTHLPCHQSVSPKELRLADGLRRRQCGIRRWCRSWWMRRSWQRRGINGWELRPLVARSSRRIALQDHDCTSGAARPCWSHTQNSFNPGVKYTNIIIYMS